MAEPRMTDVEAEAEQSMQLPPGKTCADCAHLYRCTQFGFTDSSANTHCDFAPSRFRLPAADSSLPEMPEAK